MIKKNFFIIANLFIQILFIPAVSSLTAESGNYSVTMFGSGLQSAMPQSTSYEATGLSIAAPSTGNALSSSYTANIGFFSNPRLPLAVSINSWSIYPKSALNGSIISFYISATNSQAVWLRIIRPDSQKERITLTNNGNTYYTATMVGRYNVIFYANSSYGPIASVVDYFDIIGPQTRQPPSGGGVGGGGEGIGCTYIWDCDSWSLCSQGEQTRTCKNTGTCNGTTGIPPLERACSDILFDVKIKLKNIDITENDSLNFTVELTETKGIEKIDVQVKYSLFEKDGGEIFNQIETRAVQKNLSYEKIIDEIKLQEGEYRLRVDILYGNMQRAYAEQAFRVKKVETGTETGLGPRTEIELIEDLRSRQGINYNLIYIFIAVAVFILLAILAAIKLVKVISDERRISRQRNRSIRLAWKNVFLENIGVRIGEVKDMAVAVFILIARLVTIKLVKVISDERRISRQSSRLAGHGRMSLQAEMEIGRESSRLAGKNVFSIRSSRLAGHGRMSLQAEMEIGRESSRGSRLAGKRSF